ncbi:uncharacterized protein LOC110979072 isoform X2 [Acanthaster planci]|uniref:Uncharacterized protein LOC110979072 isoform X2 n=1 Tax=Acanthaster planci TaxID=133434 RepID=A0A8B7YAL5_ACAPL|nr:uncharacterized protein LOC110979072 isoform X2 [Acanthaster planci]
MRVECIIKLGGSAVTAKGVLETEKLDEIRKFAEFLRLQITDDRRFIVVHGAGSFGHFQAKEYGVAQGYHGNQDHVRSDRVKMGFCKTRVSVTKPCGSWVTDDGSVVQSDIDSIKDLLLEGYQPVMHGDCVLDRCKGCTILSGDTVIEVCCLLGIGLGNYFPTVKGPAFFPFPTLWELILIFLFTFQKLCSVFRPKCVLFLADVDGVYDKPPTDFAAQLLPVITIGHDGELSLPVATTQQAHDVTGGILKKLKTAASIVRASNRDTSVFICRINSLAASNVMTNGKLLGEFGTEIKMQFSDETFH